MIEYQIVCTVHSALHRVYNAIMPYPIACMKCRSNIVSKLKNSINVMFVPVINALLFYTTVTGKLNMIRVLGV